MSQLSLILARLEAGHAITPIDALTDFGCFRLGARIFDLKKMGVAVETTIIEDNEKRFASYRLAASDRGGAHLLPATPQGGRPQGNGG